MRRTGQQIEEDEEGTHVVATGFEKIWLSDFGGDGLRASRRGAGRVPRADAGIDGIISQDPLELDRIYVQAKRYQTIGRPKIHEFAGALLGKQGDRGVYITTSSFSRGAREEAERINARIELIDGARLAELLVRYRVGVQAVQTVELLRLDEDFFDGL
ncbi:restriction endonuclease [Mycobacterium tuberculosis]